MNKEDVLFLDIYRSIRGDWSGGIVERGNVLIKLIDKTTLSNKLKEYFKNHFNEMIKEFGDNYFDGRDWARDCPNSYDNLMASKWFDKKYYKRNSIYDREDGHDDMITNFPVFTCNDFLNNFMKPQFHGLEPNREAGNTHPSSEKKLTLKNLKKFLDYNLDVKL
jgi:hypothetical protein